MTCLCVARVSDVTERGLWPVDGEVHAVSSPKALEVFNAVGVRM